MTAKLFASATLTLCNLLVAQTSPDQIAGVLKKSCVPCHNETQAAGKLRLDALDKVALGGASGSVVVPGQASESTLFRRVTTSDRALRMPPTGAPLQPEAIAMLKEWIDAGASGLPSTESPKPVEFVADVEPLLKKNCYPCHSGAQPKSQLRLDAKALAMRGGLGGPVILPGKSAESRLVHRIEGKGGEQRMPLKGEPLRPEEIALIRSWIDQGATWPVAQGSTEETTIAKHWAYEKPVRPAIPKVKNTDQVRSPIDALLLAKLEAQGLGFSPPASKEKLIRRVSLDLIGLPPTPAEVSAFVNDTQPGAYERVVDRLLASPHYGERWARHWLDLARYADTNGYEKDGPRTMWKYRDWVIDAFNRDMPFDQFTIEQLAGDMLPNATTAQKIATGFHRNTMFNEEGGVDREETHFEVLVDRVNTTSTVWLGSTVGCAQCHTHKYDPFTHKDYYQMMAFFNSSQKEDFRIGDTLLLWKEPQLDLATPAQEEQRQELKTRINQLEEQLKTATPQLEREQNEWERSVVRAAKEWKPLAYSELRAASGTTLAAGPGGVIVASGANPQSETYTVEAPLDRGKLSGLRLETLPDASLPQGGPGRDAYGNFILTEMRVEIGSGAGWKPLLPGRFVADDGRVQAKNSPHLWTIDASREDTRVARQIVMVARESVEVPAGAKIRVTLVQTSDLAGQNIGRFRISTTASKEPAVLAKMRARLQPVVLAPAATRSPEHAKELASFFRSIAPSLDPVREELRRRKDQLEELGIVSAMVMAEQPGYDRPSDHIRIRGSFATKGDKVYADIPSALGALPASEMPNRLGLARWFGSRKNPLTARVTMNRIWEHYFGPGIVETAEDFGSQGERPVNQPLLDWLAVEFMDRGWSLKAMHKLIVTSTAYRQTSKADEKLLQLDPYNRLISRGAKFRLEAEMVRDVGLAASGLLSRKIGGPSVFPPQPPGVWDVPYSDEKWEESQGEDKYRRSIYTFVRRSALYPALMNFDAPTRESCTVRRPRTNSPLAALTTLNDKAFFEMAQATARRILAEGGNTDVERLRYAFQLATSSLPDDGEQDRTLAFLRNERAHFLQHSDESKAAAGGADNPELASWTILANALLNLDEALTKE